MSRFPVRYRLVVFAGCGIVAALALGSALFPRAAAPRTTAATAAAAPPRDVVHAADDQLLFRTTALGPAYGRLGLAPLTHAAGPARDLALACDRVHFAGGRGICLAADRGVVTTYSASLFDEAFAVRRAMPLRGVPSRARVSPDGRLGAVTVMVNGDAYEGPGVLTRTSIVDMEQGRVVGELEDFTVYKDNMPFRAIDSSFWGVTFAQDSNRFYAALRAGGTAYLVEGDVTTRTARIVADDVDCPSLSPDGSRVAFTRRLADGRSASRLHVLELATGVVMAVAETHTVDDQVEWLDDGRIVYALPHGAGSSAVWAVAADGTGAPALLRPDAYSPTVIR
jgi:hypothetical protein